jgi:hypothetical protein
MSQYTCNIQYILTEQSINSTWDAALEKNCKNVKEELNNLINSQIEEPKYKLAIQYIPERSAKRILYLQKTNANNKGFKLNLHQKPKHWLKTLDLGAGSAISYVPPLHQDLLGIQVAKNIVSFYKQQKPHDASYNKIRKRGEKIMMDIKEKQKKMKPSLLKLAKEIL